MRSIKNCGSKRSDLTMDCVQFIGDFMTESVKVLEHISNEEQPPLSWKDLESIRDKFNDASSDKKALCELLEDMKKAFQKRGNVKLWKPIVLEEIDAEFQKHFMKGENVTFWLFNPEDVRNVEAYMQYCAGVDRVLRTHAGNVPKYAREWFAFYSIWQYHELPFPMPLGTRTVVGALEKLLAQYKPGVLEVSRI